MSIEEKIYQPQHHIRVVTATSLFDGHDAAINIVTKSCLRRTPGIAIFAS